MTTVMLVRGCQDSYHVMVGDRKAAVRVVSRYYFHGPDRTDWTIAWCDDATEPSWWQRWRIKLAVGAFKRAARRAAREEAFTAQRKGLVSEICDCRFEEGLQDR